MNDSKFMTAVQKEKVLKNWKTFIKKLRTNGTSDNIKSGSFSKALYNHLYVHCGFIAHYDIHGFFNMYFTGESHIVSFSDQLERHWNQFGLQDTYADLNAEMQKEWNKNKAKIFKKLNVSLNLYREPAVFHGGGSFGYGN